MNCLVVFAHPLPESLNRTFAATAVETLEKAGHQVTFLDLYALDFDPRLSLAERAVHYDADNSRRRAPEHADLLMAADALVLLFPTWWYGLPAILKGWIDRTFAPGFAFHHGSEKGGPMEPGLMGLKHFVAITTLGSPWWLDTLVMWQPVRRILKLAIAGGCAPKASFTYLAFHGADNPDAGKVETFRKRIVSSLARLPG